MCNACAALCTCCGKITKWIVIGIIIFFAVSIITSCILLLGPDETPFPTSPSPSVSFDLLQDSVIFKAIGGSKEPPYSLENPHQLSIHQQFCICVAKTRDGYNSFQVITTNANIKCKSSCSALYPGLMCLPTVLSGSSIILDGHCSWITSQISGLTRVYVIPSPLSEQGRLTKWIIIGVIIFFVVTAVIVPCVLLLSPEEPESTTFEPQVKTTLKQLGNVKNMYSSEYRFEFTKFNYIQGY